MNGFCDAVGEELTITYKETRLVELRGEIVDESANGITVRHTYRKGKRLEFIPRDKLESIVYDEDKHPRKPRPDTLVVEGDVTVKGEVKLPEGAVALKVTENETVTDEDAVALEVNDPDDDSEEFDDDDEFE